MHYSERCLSKMLIFALIKFADQTIWKRNRDKSLNSNVKKCDGK